MMNWVSRSCAVVLFSVITATAGSEWLLTCEHKGCNFRSSVSIGGGFNFCMATGYCTDCKEFVDLSWRRPGLSKDRKASLAQSDLPDSPPRPLGTVWNPATGLLAKLYACPKCRNPFMELQDYDLLSVQFKVADAAGVMLVKTYDSDPEGTNSASVALEELTKSERIFCPQCTNLTLRLRSLGIYD